MFMMHYCTTNKRVWILYGVCVLYYVTFCMVKSDCGTRLQKQASTFMLKFFQLWLYVANNSRSTLHKVCLIASLIWYHSPSEWPLSTEATLSNKATTVNVFTSLPDQRRHEFFYQQGGPMREGLRYILQLGRNVRLLAYQYILLCFVGDNRPSRQQQIHTHKQPAEDNVS